jgi:hypothetical protein
MRARPEGTERPSDEPPKKTRILITLKFKIFFFFLHPDSQARAGVPQYPLLFLSHAAAHKRLRCARAGMICS